MAANPTLADPGEPAAPAADRLLRAAVESFADIGYHATTTRDIAEVAGMSPAAVYVHYASKLELLKRISFIGHEEARVCLETALAAGDTSRERILNATSAFAMWHAENKKIARIVQYEHRSLPEETKEEIRVLRRRMQHLVENEIQQGANDGEFRVDNVSGAALALLSLCVDVARWYSPRDPRTPAELGELYARLVSAMLHADTSDGDSAPS